jgi:hypothetical protein
MATAISKNAWTFARTNHPRDRFAESFQAFANQFVATQKPEVASA